MNKVNRKINFNSSFYVLSRPTVKPDKNFGFMPVKTNIHLLCGMCCYYTPYILLTKNSEMIRQEWNSGLSRIIASGVIGIFGCMLILVSFTIERISYIVGLRPTCMVFAVLMGSHFLKEKHKGIRMTGSLIILAGGFLISLSK